MRLKEENKRMQIQSWEQFIDLAFIERRAPLPSAPRICFVCAVCIEVRFVRLQHLWL